MECALSLELNLDHAIGRNFSVRSTSLAQKDSAIDWYFEARATSSIQGSFDKAELFLIVDMFPKYSAICSARFSGLFATILFVKVLGSTGTLSISKD